ncbi:GNAT family N-acetyltransferase [Chelatococcus sp. SYSU_G07232]|uniref:GNAT family N-acetyltransferase n=1 Tax=Chelatococcus albus TaxID=3047466 RepID=A0ABT7AG61_9HYPH|nr:GNAT family N-acetyltransferase [Chelatococcus sp. SYSU_G07232]MDJ1158361.1 GNAT family N-acetyltransferase [Chelatococcus sp. SYSU_G07232]
MTTKLRPAHIADLDSLLAIEAACFATDRLSRRALRHAMVSAAGAALVAERSGTVVAYGLAAFRKGSRLGRITSLAVQPQAAGNGIGRALLAALGEEAVRRGCSHLRLEVRPDNAAAIRLYERAGYRHFGEYPDFYEDGSPALRYEKALARASLTPST